MIWLTEQTKAAFTYDIVDVTQTMGAFAIDCGKSVGEGDFGAKSPSFWHFDDFFLSVQVVAWG